jgi:hypothetical protein
MNLRDLRKLIKNKKEIELTNYKGEGWVLHICKNNVPVPLFHSKDKEQIKRFLEINEK